MSFWTDTKIADDFSPEEKLMYLYLMTNPHTNLCGCYEVSTRQIIYETGMTENAVKKTLGRLEKDHKVIVRSEETREVLLPNWYRYNWTASEKFRKPLFAQINAVKNDDFKDYLIDLYNGMDSVSIPYQYGSDTTDTVTDTDTVPVIKETPSELNKALSDFKKHRRQLKAPMTDRAFELMVGKLEKLSGGDERKKIAILNQSIENGWKGVFELKTDGFNNHTPRDRKMNELELKLLETN
jgi:hypothetical protein